MITSMIFFPEKTFYEKPSDYGYDWQDVDLQTKDGVRIHGWFLKAKREKGVILFFHGNAGNISNRLSKVKGWVDRDFSVFLLDYRGYGKSEGKIENESNIYEDGETAFKWLVRKVEAHGRAPLQKIILYGESIGSAPAIRIASSNPVGAVILEAPFTSFFELARTHYPFVPAAFLKDFEFSNMNRIAELKAPLFILHGTRDEICPYAMAGELLEKAPEPKALFSITGGLHNDLPMAAGEDYWEKPYEFVTKHLKQ